MTEFGYAAPPDWFSIPFIVVWLVEFLILFFLYKRYRIKKRLAWSRVIQIFVLTVPTLLSCRIPIVVYFDVRARSYPGMYSFIRLFVLLVLLPRGV